MLVCVLAIHDERSWTDSSLIVIKISKLEMGEIDIQFQIQIT